MDAHQPSPATSIDVEKLHREALVIDGHTDVPMRLDEKAVRLTDDLPDYHSNLPKLRQGGVNGLFFALYVPSGLSPERGWERILRLYHRVREQLQPGQLELVRGTAELRETVARGAVAVLLGIENGRPLQLPGTLERCAEMGVRYVTLTHISSHEWCDASTDLARHGGLSEQGVQLVQRMNELGILPDVSHVSDDAVQHALEVSRGPLIASHSSCRALCDHPRNLPDDLIRDIAAKGGVVMANSYPPFVDQKAAEAAGDRLQRFGPLMLALDQENSQAAIEIRQRLVQEWPLPPVSLERYVDHLVHLVAVAGPEHVGIGSDFDGIPEVLHGFENASCFPALTAALVERGLDVRPIRGILGENILRLLQEAEDAAT